MLIKAAGFQQGTVVVVLPPFENGHLMPSHSKCDNVLKNYIAQENSLRTLLFNGVRLLALLGEI